MDHMLFELVNPYHRSQGLADSDFFLLPLPRKLRITQFSIDVAEKEHRFLDNRSAALSSNSHDQTTKPFPEDRLSMDLCK